MINEQEKFEYILDEYRTIIEETKMKINVVKQMYRGDLDTMLKMTHDLENKIKMLERGLLKPYFARIDFNSTDNSDICYIGKVGVLNYDNEVVTVDWRAPISSLYYDANIGSCSYVAPEGIIEGELTLKRQYDIENGVLNSYNDVDTVANDELLKPYLDVSVDNRLKNIVASIQSEQNEIIRKPIEKNIIVQGVAGSGKTTVALHRIAYLAYNYRNIIDANQYMVIGPNKFFVNYISSVLPDLDVNDVKQYDFGDLAKDFLEEDFKIIDTKDNESTNYKTSFMYKDVIDLYVNDLDKKVIPDHDLEYLGCKLLSKEFIKNIYDGVNGKNIKVKVDKCILLVEKEISNMQEKLILKSNKYIDLEYENETNNTKKKELIKNRELIKNEIKNNCHNLLIKYFNIVNESILSLYGNLLTNIFDYEKNEVILKYLKKDIKNLKNKKIEYEDLSAIMYLKYKISGANSYSNFKHIVIDESQDYNELIFYTFKCLFKNATFSIFGDLAQSIYPYRSIEDWNIIKEKVMDLDIMNLSKSYRTSIEIMNEANKINRYLNLNEAEPVIRHGNIPKYVKIDNYDYILDRINEYKNKYNSIAIISKSENDSNEIYDYLKDKIDITNLNYDSEIYSGGICTITSDASKGLEFDVVIINKCDSDVFDINNNIDMKLLYVSMTRPLHELIITYNKDLVSILK